MIRDDECVVCPFCDYRHGDAWEWVKEHPLQKECDECGREFVYWAEYSVDYISQPLVPGGKFS